MNDQYPVLSLWRLFTSSPQFRVVPKEATKRLQSLLFLIVAEHRQNGLPLRQILRGVRSIMSSWKDSQLLSDVIQPWLLADPFHLEIAYDLVSIPIESS